MQTMWGTGAACRPLPMLNPDVEGDSGRNARLERFLRTRPETPYLVVDLDEVVDRYEELRVHFPGSPIHYAVKANPSPEIVDVLARAGSNFDAASLAEILLCLERGVPAKRISYGNTIKKTADIARAHEVGVRQFVFDSEAELLKLAGAAPGSEVSCRLLTSGTSAGWPLSRKFGCAPDMAFELLRRAPGLGLVPAGLSFHAGSQQMNPREWEAPIIAAASLFRRLAREGIRLRRLNIGGGFPAQYDEPVPPVSRYAEVIEQAFRRAFGSSRPEIMLEPGRSVVGDAGLIETEVVLVSRKSACDPVRWVFLDLGKFGGLMETMNESIRYRVRTPRTGAPGPVVLAGPTCDSADILYERAEYRLPVDLREGDRIVILSAGAYTSAYSAVCFNGFAPLRTICLPRERS